LTYPKRGDLPTNLKRVVRHPFLWGVALWAVAHLLTIGDAASVVLFGSYAVFAFFDMASTKKIKVSGGTAGPTAIKRD
jgi:uncharacterized membrane protein